MSDSVIREFHRLYYEHGCQSTLQSRETRL